MLVKHHVNLVRALSLATGIILCFIGIRFLLQPQIAGTFFGIDPRWPGYAPHAAIALRDVWVGALLLAFTALQDWRAVALWLAFGALVCFGDAIIAASSSGRWVSMIFHVSSGVFCAALAAAAWRLAQRRPVSPEAGA